LRTGCWREHLDSRGRKWQEARQKCPMMSFIICTLQEMWLWWSNWGGWKWEIGRWEMRIEFWLENLKKRDHLEDLGVDERIILKQIFDM